MKHNILIILSKVYPYYPEFIQDEVPYIKDRYDKVIVITCSKNRKDSVRQPIADNFEIFGRDEIQNKWLKYFVYIFKGLFCFRREKYYLDELTGCSGMKEKLAALYTIGKVESELKFVKRVLNEFTFSRKEKIYVYSFWFTDTAVIASYLKDTLHDNRVYAFTRAHRADLYEDRNLSKSLPFRTFCLQKLDKVYPCSISGEKYLRERYPLYADKIEHKYLGVKDRGARIYCGNHKSINIVSCSNIITVKRVEFLAEAMVELERRNVKNINWICFGGGDLLPVVKEKCSLLKSIKVFFKGPTKNEDIMQFYTDMDIDLFINVSSSEGLPVSIMEAMSFGIPVLATNVGGTSEIVINGITGILMDVNLDAATLADYIENFIRLPLEIRESMSMNARRIFCEKFDSSHNYDEFHKELTCL